MAECIMVGCDLHDKSMLLKIAVDRGRAQTRSWGTDLAARCAMIAELKRRAAEAGAGRIVFAYEACGFGFLLHDELAGAGIECHVLAPSKMERSARQRRRKTDERDAEAILDDVRSYVLAGVKIPSVWIPDVQTRDDRELVRHRLGVAADAAAVQTKIRWLLKRSGIESVPGKVRTEASGRRLEELMRGGELGGGAAAALASLLRQLQWFREELQRLDAQVRELSRTPRWASAASAVCRIKGVGVGTAMAFLTELGDMGRFANRQQVGSFLGLTPGSHESGQDSDHKGHITHQGPARVRKALCQAVWVRLRVDPAERAAYDRIVSRNPKHKKIAVVARMRMLGIEMWHHALEAQQAQKTRGPDGPVPAPASCDPTGSPRPALTGRPPRMPRRCVPPPAATDRPPRKDHRQRPEPNRQT
jgi:transposase